MLLTVPRKWKENYLSFYGKTNKNRGFSRLEKQTNKQHSEISWMADKQELKKIEQFQGDSSRRNAENGMSQSQGVEWQKIWWGTRDK